MTEVQFTYETLGADQTKVYESLRSIIEIAEGAAFGHGGAATLAATLRAVLFYPDKTPLTVHLAQNKSAFTCSFLHTVGKSINSIAADDNIDEEAAAMLFDKITELFNLVGIRAVFNDYQPDAPAPAPAALTPAVPAPAHVASTPTLCVNALARSILVLTGTEAAEIDYNTANAIQGLVHLVAEKTRSVQTHQTSQIESIRRFGDEIGNLKTANEMLTATTGVKDKVIESLQGDVATKDGIISEKETLNGQLTAQVSSLKDQLEASENSNQRMIEVISNEPNGSPACSFANSFMASPPCSGHKRSIEESFGDGEKTLSFEWVNQCTDRTKRNLVFDELLEGIDETIFSKLNPKEMKNADKTLRTYFKYTDDVIIQVDFNPTNSYIMVAMPGNDTTLPDDFKEKLISSINTAINVPDPISLSDIEQP